MTLIHHLLQLVYCLLILAEFINAMELSMVEHTDISLLQIHLKLTFQRTVLMHMYRRHHHEFRAFTVLFHAVHDVFCGVFLYFNTGNRRVCTTNTGKKKSQIVIYLSGCTHRTAWISRNHFLFNGNGWRQSFDVIAGWF